MKATATYRQILKVRGEIAILERMLTMTNDGQPDYGLTQQIQNLNSYFYNCEYTYADKAAKELIETTKPKVDD